MKRPATQRTAAFLGLMIAVVIGPSPASLAADILVAAGSSAPVHLDMARAVCRQVQTASDAGSCEAHAIEGRDAADAIAVLSAVRAGAIEIAIVPSDWHHHAVHGTGPFEFMDVTFDSLRSLFSLHSEPFTLVARVDSGIDRLDDLAGKRVNIGSPGSGHRTAMDMVMAVKGWSRDSFQLTEELTEAEQSLALCHNRVQAVVLTAAHPNASLAKTMELCNAKLVEVMDDEIAELITDRDFLAATEVSKEAYTMVDQDVGTFGALVTVLASEDLADDEAYEIVKSVFENLDDFRGRHPALSWLMRDRMATDGLSAPLHPGAVRYFKEQAIL